MPGGGGAKEKEVVAAGELNNSLGAIDKGQVRGAKMLCSSPPPPVSNQTSALNHVPDEQLSESIDAA